MLYCFDEANEQVKVNIGLTTLSDVYCLKKASKHMSLQLCKDIESNFQHWLRKQLPARMFTTNAKIYQDNFAKLDYLNYRIKGMCNLVSAHDELYISCSLFFISVIV